MPGEPMYYYMCAKHIPTDQIHCLKHPYRFRNFYDPHEYTKFIAIALSQKTAERKCLLSSKGVLYTGGLLMRIATLISIEPWSVVTGEQQILRAELGTDKYMILDNKYTIPNK